MLRDRQPDARGGDRGPARRTALGSALTPACPNAEWQTDGRGQQRFEAAAAAPSKGFLHSPLPRPHPGKRGLHPARRAEPAGRRWPLCSGDPREPGPGEVLLTPPPLSLAAALGSGASHPHFTEEQTEAQGSYPPKSHSWPSAGSGPRSAGRSRACPRPSPRPLSNDTVGVITQFKSACRGRGHRALPSVWLKATEICSLTALKTRRPKPRCLQGRAPPKGRGRDRACARAAPRAAGSSLRSWLIAAGVRPSACT